MEVRFMSHKAYEELVLRAVFGPTHERDDKRLRHHAATCQECRRQSIDLREIPALTLTDESEEARRSRVLKGFRRVLDAQLDECDKWESSGDLYIVWSQLVN